MRGFSLKKFLDISILPSRQIRVPLFSNSGKCLPTRAMGKSKLKGVASPPIGPPTAEYTTTTLTEMGASGSIVSFQSIREEGQFLLTEVRTNSKVIGRGTCLDETNRDLLAKIG